MGICQIEVLGHGKCVFCHGQCIYDLYNVSFIIVNASMSCTQMTVFSPVQVIKNWTR
jgi:hypothetical protein